MAHFDSRSHSTLLSASLENLQLSGYPPKIVPDQEDGADDKNVMNEFHPTNLIENIIDPLGQSTKANFRQSSSPPATGVESPIPDPNGLGWPGAASPGHSQTTYLSFIRFPAKSTLLRLNATPAEKLEREQRLAGAVRTILECLGEDPDREGLRKTPERYAKALMWMTRGYEERLKGR